MLAAVGGGTRANPVIFMEYLRETSRRAGKGLAHAPINRNVGINARNPDGNNCAFRLSVPPTDGLQRNKTGGPDVTPSGSPLRPSNIFHENSPSSASGPSPVP